jgi:hypothetical protein
VIAATLPTIQEYFSDDEVQFFEESSARSLAGALVSVASDPQAGESRAERTSRRCGSYRWDLNARASVAILERLSSGRDSSPISLPRA